MLFQWKKQKNIKRKNAANILIGNVNRYFNKIHINIILLIKNIIINTYIYTFMNSNIKYVFKKNFPLYITIFNN